MSSRAQKGRQSCSGASSVSMAFLDSGGCLVSPQGIRPWGPQAVPQPFLWLLWSDVLPGQVNPQERPTNQSTNRVPSTNGPRHSRRFGEKEGSHRPHTRHLYNAQAAGGIQVPLKPSNINLVFKSFLLICLFKSRIKTTDNLLCKTWGEEWSRKVMAVGDMELDEKAQSLLTI